ncbi:hypothetical protein [Mucilaginibacter sp. KACC 22063]|nr:hypothetical protein [Mucilaginibacter sp. KACC 22063]WDF55857.1 hypothetical protein PQ461_02120 [Mucilaginibacter sp. KACC 22063]
MSAADHGSAQVNVQYNFINEEDSRKSSGWQDAAYYNTITLLK